MEIAYALAQKLGLELVIDDMDFDGALLAVQNGKSDMVMAGVTVNEERLVNMDFTDSYANGVQVVIVPEDSDIQTIEDLEGKKIGTSVAPPAIFIALTRLKMVVTGKMPSPVMRTAPRLCRL